MPSIAGRVILKWLVALISISLIAGTVIALEVCGQYKISYVIQPAIQASTLNPSTVALNLGTIPSGSTGSKDFGKTATLSLPASYTITFELDTTTTK